MERRPGFVAITSSNSRRYDPLQRTDQGYRFISGLPTMAFAGLEAVGLIRRSMRVNTSTRNASAADIVLLGRHFTVSDRSSWRQRPDASGPALGDG
jgi:hypothetical protein